MSTLLKKAPLKAFSKIYKNIEFEYMTTIIPVTPEICHMKLKLYEIKQQFEI